MASQNIKAENSFMLRATEESLKIFSFCVESKREESSQKDSLHEGNVLTSGRSLLFPSCFVFSANTGRVVAKFER
jgi:hypothetical protein